MFAGVNRGHASCTALQSVHDQSIHDANKHMDGFVVSCLPQSRPAAEANWNPDSHGLGPFGSHSTPGAGARGLYLA